MDKSIGESIESDYETNNLLQSNLNKESYSNSPKLMNIGPNVNIKFPKNIYRSTEQKEFFKRKICLTKKTELCKNWVIYGDCFYKDKCCFAHGEHELRNKIFAKNDDNEKYKTKQCRKFEDIGYCAFGNRCQYTHIVSNNRLLSYKAINFRMATGILNEALKTENEQFDFMKLLDNTHLQSPLKL